MKHLLLKISAVIFLSVCLLSQTTAAAEEEARLTNIIVTNTSEDLLLNFDVEGAFREKMVTAIESGVPATFSYFITLHKVRNLWKDKKIADIDITHTIKYNNLKNEYVVTRPWTGSEPVVTTSFEEAQRLMSKIESLKIIELNRLQKGNQYQISAKAELSKVTLPLYLHYILFFVSLWDFETDWYTLDFDY